MRKRTRIKKYFTDNPEVLESVRKEIARNDYDVKDEEIPSFNDFLMRNNSISHYFKDQGNKQHYSQLPSAFCRRLKIFVPIAAALLFGFFMAFSTPGNALADNIYKTVIQWFGNSVEIQHGASGTYAEAEEPVPEYYETFEAIQSDHDIKFATSIKASLNDKIEVKRVDPSLTVIKSAYLYRSQEFFIIQSAYSGKVDSSTSYTLGDAQPIDETLDNDLRFVGYAQGTFGIVSTYEDSINSEIRVYSEGTDYDTFIDFIRSIIISQ